EGHAGGRAASGRVPGASPRTTPSAGVGGAGARRRAPPTPFDGVLWRGGKRPGTRRYDTANALAADLQRFLDHEPLQAGPPSAAYRLKKVLRRYRRQVLMSAAVLATAVLGAGFAIDYAVQAKANESRANENATELARKVHEFDQLAVVVLCDRAIASEKELYPAWPHNVAAMEAWLRDDASKLLSMRGDIERTVHDLEARTLPATD